MKNNKKFPSLFGIFNVISFQIKTLMGIAFLLLFANSAFAAASCPAEQRLYYVGAAAPASAYKSLPLSGWTEGSVTRTYTFSEASGNKSLTINFPLFLDKYTTYSSQPPYYGTLSGATLNAITMIHNSTQTKVNHRMDVTVNTPVAKFGYVIQDIDSAQDGNGSVPYQEAVNVASTGGRLTYDPTYHTINPNLDIVTSILRVACNGDAGSYACPIEATWGAKTANSPFSLTHSNEFSQYNGAHVLGYSDFYFCLAPPKITVKKQLDGPRVNDSSGNRDQFTISINNGASTLTSFETTGSGQTVTNASSSVISLAENTSYTITEKVTSSATGDIANYNASYSCTNSTTNSNTVMPSSAMTYNATTKTRSFTLSNVAYGDDISCTIVNSPKSVFDPGSSLAPATCPADHRMYYLGATPPSSAYSSQPLAGWTAGTDSKIYSFNEPSGNKTFTISFASVVDKYTAYSEQSPFYGDIPNATQNAINLIQNSPAAKSNHTLNVTVNKPVSKLGYVIQDLDSTSNNNDQVPYQERVDVSGSLGTLNSQPTYHTINGSNNIVTALRGINCQTANSCPINATWGYKATNSPFSLVHSNILAQYDAPHAVAYSDFYFCMAPPKVVIKKQLTGNRVNDSASNRDQFTISVNNGNTSIASFETTGSGQTITNNSGAITLAESTSYTITERVTSSAIGDITNYNATYTCTNSTAGSPTVMPTTAMTYNAATKTRSFTLANVNYGDEITCTIVNSPASYTFSGIVFNDNGGIVASDDTRQDISTTFVGNGSYFNGIYDSASEVGLYDSNLSIRLTDCNGNNLTTVSSNPQAVSNVVATRGRYSFTVAASALVNKTKVCVVENEPSVWDYAVDTNTDNREVTLVANVYTYSNLDFGEVKANNAALVLIKSQYVHECNNNLDYQAVSTNAADPTVGFSINPISGVSPGKCIAYSVRAYNRGHVGLQQVQIRDQLQITPVTSVFQQPAPLFIPTSVSSPTVSYGSNGEIRSNLFSLAATPSTSAQPNSATLYFNTKYGSTQ